VEAFNTVDDFLGYLARSWLSGSELWYYSGPCTSPCGNRPDLNYLSKRLPFDRSPAWAGDRATGSDYYGVGDAACR